MEEACAQWVAKWDVPSCVDDVAHPHGRDIEPERGRHAGKRVAQLGDARLGVHQPARQRAQRSQRASSATERHGWVQVVPSLQF